MQETIVMLNTTLSAMQPTKSQPDPVIISSSVIQVVKIRSGYAAIHTMNSLMTSYRFTMLLRYGLSAAMNESEYMVDAI